MDMLRKSYEYGYIYYESLKIKGYMENVQKYLNIKWFCDTLLMRGRNCLHIKFISILFLSQVDRLHLGHLLSEKSKGWLI